MIAQHAFTADHSVDRRAVFGLDRAAPLSAALIAAAVAVGRMPGEPDRIIEPAPPRGWFDELLRGRRPSPLADPRLEVLRAISASLARRPSEFPADLVAAADRSGWTLHDLWRFFPAAFVQGAA